MKSIVNAMGDLSFFAGVSVIATTIITIFLFYMYSEKIFLEEKIDGNKETLDAWWYLALFITELMSQVMSETYLDFEDAIFILILNVIVNAIIFFICYGILTLVGVDRENKYKRCQKSFMGLVILSCLLVFLADYAIKNGLG